MNYSKLTDFNGSCLLQKFLPEVHSNGRIRMGQM